MKRVDERVDFEFETYKAELHLRGTEWIENAPFQHRIITLPVWLWFDIDRDFK